MKLLKFTAFKRTALASKQVNGLKNAKTDNHAFQAPQL
jgi:hypothetical protein